jgi:hypothetical protein
MKMFLIIYCEAADEDVTAALRYMGTPCGKVSPRRLKTGRK